MRVAIAGKGGAGKTTIAATLARLLAREGNLVVAVDADSNPNLTAALGASAAPEGAGFLPAGLVSRRLDGPRLTAPVDEVLGAHGIPAPDGVKVVLMGAPAHADEGCLCAAHATVSALLADLGDVAGYATVVDMEASPEHLSRGTARHVDSLWLVTEPYYRSLETIRRLAGLAADLPIPRMGVVANKLRSDRDTEAVGDFCLRHGLDLVAAVPWSEAVMDADVAGVPLLDQSDDVPLVTAMTTLVDELTGAGRS